MADADDIAGVGVNSAGGFQAAAVQQVAHTQRAARAGFFIRHTGQRGRLLLWIDQAHLAQQDQGVHAAGDTGLVVGRAPPE